MHPVVFENVRKFYGEKAALDGVSLSIPPNQTTAIIGPSGSGKSTLLQLVNGLLAPDGGRVYVFGEEIDYGRLPELRRRIGYAVQGTGLFPHLTVKKNITLLAWLARWERSEIETRLHELLELVDLPRSYLNRYPHQLSGGEQQRVGLCRAMMLKPSLFLLDEPFGALDPVTRSEIHREFLKLQKSETRTTLLVTHDLREAFKLAHQIVILHRGRVSQVGTRTDVLRRPANEFVQRFVHLQLEDEIELE